MKKIVGGSKARLVLGLTIAAVLVFTVSYAYAMACPEGGAVEFGLRLESVTVDGVPQEDLSAYDHQSISLTGFLPQEAPKAGWKNFSVAEVVLRFRPRVEGPGTYDEIYSLDSDNR